ncbi:hypothetical protein GCM10020358_68810 [Amorphoplanes nipponensis]|uniref:Uncharacterized protein n=1 Tax=Actinoplanes nipponensis TaxID=135950 RepID=A0A919JIR6_9ACTN|nr:hypothetical protein [Actinoplanes nipponensis]GIE51493.1 hypothetical protein Ani05nite_50270 [Actinoplanes nipponensis]
MNPLEPGPAHRGLEPWRNDTRTDRWLNSTGYAAPSADTARPTVDQTRREWQHHVEQLRRKAWTVVAVTAAAMIAITVAVIVVQARSTTGCAAPVPATVRVVAP